MVMNFENWLVENYTESDDALKAGFLIGDVRDMSVSDRNNQEELTTYTLIDDSDEYALDLEISKGGELELSATIYRDLSEIEEIWPR